MPYYSLYVQMTKRTLLDRYRGSFVGVMWVVLYPLFMVSIYTFVFGDLLQAKWTQAGDSVAPSLPFSISVFSGLLVFLMVAEVLSKAPTSVSSQISYVKKVKFPLALLAVIDVTIAYFNAMVAWLVMCLAALLLGVELSWSAALVPLFLVTLAPLLVGLHWTIGAVAVFLRDVEQIITPILTLFLFLSPVFYTLDSVNAQLVTIIQLNPLTFWMQGVRDLLIGDLQRFTLITILLYLGLIGAVLVLGRRLFIRLQEGFADVL
jgi:lipopolysaccharide transport system permease protein